MRFGYACPHGHEIITEFPIGKAAPDIECDKHHSNAVRVFDAPSIQEDRRGMAGGSGWSWALGQPAPQSRSEMRVIEKSRGIEFVTKAEARADAQRLREGKNLDEPTKLPKGYLAKEIAKRNIRFDRSGSAPRALTREESERKLEAERGWDSVANAEAKVVAPEKLPG